MNQHCCEMMTKNINHQCDLHESPYDCPDHLIIHSNNGGYGIIVHDGGSSSITIKFCPWCGEKLG
ncbi:MAG: hypothetical protein COA78_18285 [Blastopirellula sp.]|nr:MAG: hypothetical protein COA78_18285 [Blastopirellula sp.]